MQGCAYTKYYKKNQYKKTNLIDIKLKKITDESCISFWKQTHPISLQNHHKLIKTKIQNLFEKNIN